MVRLFYKLLEKSKPPALEAGGFFCAPGRAHSLGGESPLRTLMTGPVSGTARAAAARWGLEEAVGKAPARGTRSA